MHIDELFRGNFMGVNEAMPSWRYLKMLAALRWPGQQAVDEEEVSSVDEDFKLTQGKRFWEKFFYNIKII